MIFPQQGHKKGFTAGKKRGNVIHRICRSRDQGHITRINEGKGQVGNPLFAAYQ